MEKIRKFDRIYRICPKKLRGIRIPKSLLENAADPPKRKKCFEEDEVKELLSGHTILEEKIDGGVIGLAWDGDKHLAIGKHSMINPYDNSKKVFGLNSWIYQNYERVQQIPKGWVVYGEWMKASHNIFYDELPSHFMTFDVWNGHEYLDFQSKSEFLHGLGFEQVPFICNGTDLEVTDILRIADGISMSNKSRFSSGEIFEGIVIKNYEKGMMGKYVRREFLDSIEENWLNLPIVENRLQSYKKS